MNYQDQLRSPEWKKRRKEILNRDNYTCLICHNNCGKLHVHHSDYTNGLWAWEYTDEYLLTVCEDCHEALHYFKAEYKEIWYYSSTGGI
jgi:5-methylcytosine-specific restriction endonuclease McrA